MIYDTWAADWNIPPDALADLKRRMGFTHTVADSDEPQHSETNVQSRVRLEVARLGGYAWRNNVGAGTLDSGVFVRFGLANESEKQNKQIKSSDLVGWDSVLITPAHVGQTIARFNAWECKHAGWTFRGTERELAQLEWLHLVESSGGVAAFVTDPLKIREVLNVRY